jgi:hypothetical protein
MKAFLFAALLLPLLAGCSSLSSHKNPAVKLGDFQRFYVEHRLSDDRGIDVLITRELQRRGFQASHGYLTMMPDDTQVIISYDDRWTWDFRTYLMELNISAVDARKKKLIATGTYRVPGPVSREPEALITEILDSFFK